MPRSRLDGLAVALMVLMCASWGFQQVTIKVANAGIPPMIQGGLRSLGATLLIGLWCVARGMPLFERDRTLWPGIVAGLLFGFEFVLIYFGLTLTTASRSIILLYTAPFVVTAGAAWLLPGERLRWLQVFGLVLAFAGVVAAFSDGLTAPTPGQLLGDLCAFGAAVLWGATTLVIKATKLAKTPPIKVLLYQLAVSAALLLLIALLVGESWQLRLTPLIAGAMAYQVLWIGCFTFLAWFWMVSVYPAPMLSAFTFLAPLFGVLFGHLLLGDRLTPGLLLALAAVVAGLFLVNRPGQPPIAAAAKSAA